MKGEDNLQTQQLIGTASKSSLFGPVMNSLLTKLVRSKILASFFLAFLLTSTASREKKRQPSKLPPHWDRSLSFSSVR